MASVGVRELRQRASELLRRVEAGETIEVISNGDFETYWSHHLEQEHRRVHGGRYASANAAPHELALAA